MLAALGLEPWCLASLVLVGALLARGILRLKRDFFFFVVYVQILAYLHIAPTLDRAYVEESLHESYSQVQYWSFLLLECPLILLYAYLVNKAERRYQAAQALSPTVFIDNPGRQKILWIYAIAFALVFVYAAVSTDTVFLWFGNEGNLSRLSRMDTVDFAIYRSFLLTGFFTTGFLVLVGLNSRSHPRLMRIALVVFGGIYLVRNMLNSRLVPVLTLLLLLGLMATRPDRCFTVPAWRPGWWLVAGMGVLSVYSVVVATRVRELYGVRGGFSAEMFNPFVPTGWVRFPHMRLSLRMNGVDLVARIASGIGGNRYAWGDAWTIPVYVIVGQLFDREAVAEYKKSFEGSPKRYLMQRYTSLSGVDYPSCLLTDLYGNFGVLGFPILGLILGALLGRTTVGLTCPRKSKDFLVAVYCFALVAQFEAEFITVLIGWVRVLPILLFLYWTEPFAVERCRAGAYGRAWRGLRPAGRRREVRNGAIPAGVPVAASGNPAGQ